MIGIVMFFIVIMIIFIIFGPFTQSRRIENFPIEVEVESDCNKRWNCPSCKSSWDLGDCFICNGGIYNRRW